MLALRVNSLVGPDGLSVDEVPEPVRRHDGRSVQVAVRAAGVSYLDTLVYRGQFDCVLHLPFIPGMEISGEVTTAPPGSGYAIGDRVVGYVGTGGFAEIVWVAPDMVAPLPRELSFAEGAASVVNFHTALVALWRRAQLCAGESVLVHGAGGGLGSAMVQVAAALGARVVAVASSPSRQAVARAAGASDVCGPDEWYDAVRAAGGVDIIIDPVGGEVFEQSLRCLAPEGRLVTVGCTSNTTSRMAPEHLLLQCTSILGMSWAEMLKRDRSLFARTAKQLDDLVASGLRPIVTKTYGLADGKEAMTAIENRTATGKLVLTMP
ncbi:MAG TPA: NADPH:quinone oxidoreductase family protein [Pseudonocardia sp.]|jgi:NADPH2:quinone reductase|nr:NADPH:quinone oxidoreductase family protein [Pseudonocardia sp.]